MPPKGFLVAGLMWIAVTVTICTAASGARIGLGRGGSGAPAPITSVTFGSAFNYNSGWSSKYILGDTFFSTWADDGNTYVTCNDCNGFQTGGTSGNQHDIRQSTLSTLDSSTTGTEVNATTTFNEWGGNSLSSVDDSNFKSGGLISISGTLYLEVHRFCNNTYFYNGTLVKSTNHGASWTPSTGNSGGTTNPYSSIMWAGQTSGGNVCDTGGHTAYNRAKFPSGFIQYGQDYTGNGPDGSGTYVYAYLSVDGPSSGGGDSTPAAHKVFLARVLISAISNLNAADWQYYTGAGSGGLDPLSWSSSVASAVPVLDGNSCTGCSGQPHIPGVYGGTGQYLPHYGQYLYVGETTPTGSPYTTTTDAFVANQPWGPYTHFAQQTINPQGYYFPAISPKSLVSGGQQVTLIESGNFLTNDNNPGDPGNYYTMWLQPVTMTP
jgi:hypothetical protein